MANMYQGTVVNMANVDNMITSIEKRYGVQAIESEASNLFYIQDEDRLGMGILTIVDDSVTCTLLNKKQIKALIKELKDVYDMLFN